MKNMVFKGCKKCHKEINRCVCKKTNWKFRYLIGLWVILGLISLWLALHDSKRLIEPAHSQISSNIEDFLVYNPLTSTSFLGVYSPLQRTLASKPTDGLLNQLIDRLIECESGGKIDAINHDDGAIGLHSRGVLQFQIPTFLHYNAIYKVLPDLEDGEVMNVIYDETAQRELAKKIIADGGWKNWYICSKKIGIDKLL